MINKKYAEILLHTITKARRQPNGRKLRRQGKRLERNVQKELTKQAQYIIREAKKIAQKKDLEDDLDDIFDNLPSEQLNKDILKQSAITIKFGADYRIKKNRLADIGISFDLDHPEAIKYLKTDRPLVLAKMSETTKNWIKPLLLKGVEEGASPQALAKEIREHFAFSKSRSLMIASNEVGTAYGYGNWIPMKDVVDAGYTATKSWLTVGDDRVTEECRANAGMGEIDFEEEFESGDDNAPRTNHPRCRCDTLYDYN